MEREKIILKLKGGKAKKIKLLVVLLLVAAVLIFVGGRYLVDRYFQEVAEEIKISKDMDNSEIVSSKSLHGKLPGKFPKQFPVYKNVVIEESWETESKENYAASVVWKTEAPTKDVYTFYIAELAFSGYETSVLSDDGDSYTISINKGSESGFVGIIKGDGQNTLISVTIGEEKN